MVDILDEETYIKNILENGMDPVNWRRDLILLTKYKKSIGEKKRVAKDEILQKCQMYVVGYDDITDYKHVSSLFEKTWREWKIDRNNPENSSKFRTIRSIEFPKEVLDWFLHLDETFEISDERVKELQDFRHDIIKPKNITNFPFNSEKCDRIKILFTMFVWDKIQSQYTSSSDWVQRKQAKKFKQQANLSQSCNLWHEQELLKDLGFIRISNKGNNAQAIFLQQYDVFKTPVTDENRVVMKRDELYDIGLYFDKIKFNFYVCQECGRDVIIYRKTVGKPPKYCRDCAKKKRNHIKNEYFCQDCGKPLKREEIIGKNAINKKMVLYCNECFLKRKRESSVQSMRKIRASAEV